MADDENKTLPPADTENSPSAITADNKGHASESAPPSPEAQASATHKEPLHHTPPLPPKAFWWRALLMITVVLVLFSTIRYMANGHQPGTLPPAGSAPPSLPLADGENVTIEEAPSMPPTSAVTPVPGDYSSPYPPPQGGYDYPPPYPLYPYYTPWYPPQYPRYPLYPPGHPANLAEQLPNDSRQ